jgi:hypothetical protein
VDGNDSHEFFANGILVHNCFVEEIDELTEDKALEAVRALSERCRQQIPGGRSPFLCLGSTSQGQKGLYRIYNHFKKSGTGFALIRGRTEDNPYLPASMIQDMKKMYSAEEKCIAASEKILVRHNSRIFRCRAKNISVGWEVFTRIGWQRIRQVRVSGMKPVGRLLGLRLTGDHRVETGFGWKRADSVKTAQIYDEKEIIVWTRLQELKIAVKEARRKLFDMMENSGTGIQSRQDRVAKTIGAVVQNAIRDVKAICCMSIYGNSGTVRCLKVLWYITWTTIRIIMLLRILSRFRCRNIVCCISMIPVCGKKAFPLFGRCTRIARVIQRFANCAGKRFLRNTGVRGFAGRTKTLSDEETLNVVRKKERGMRCGSLSVSIAEKLFTGIRRTLISVLLRAGKRMPLLERFLPCVPVVVKCSWRKVKKHAFVPVNAEQDTSICEVIDIEVEKPHEFVAKGLLVHNCVFMDGEFLAIAKGRVLGDFSWERNYLDYDLDTALLPGETVYVGMDFNTSYNRASAYVVRDGVIYCIKYYDFPDPQDAPSVFRHDFPAQRILWIPDVTIKDSFPQFARELRKYGLQIIYRKKNPLVEDTVFLVNKLFYTGRLMVCKIAKDLAEACALAMRDKDNKIPKGVGPSSAIHSVDGLRYVTSFVCMRDKAFHDIRKLIIDKRASFRSDSDKPIQDLGGGYMQIDPSALYHGKKL